MKRIILFLPLVVSMLLASSQARAQGAPQAGQSWSAPLGGNATLDMAWIPAGTFAMGSPAAEPLRKVDEGPQFQVTVTKGYWLGKTIVTIGQWTRVMGVSVRDQLLKEINDEALYEINGRQQRIIDLMRWSRTADPATYLGNEGEAVPMYFVSWNDATAFSQRLTERERTAGRLPAGYAYRLPTEAQWEYACRAGTTDPTYAGPSTPDVLDRISWYSVNSADGYTGRPVGTTRFGPRDVGKKQPNRWGLYDMLGNIWEWCLDWYGPYSAVDSKNPSGPPAGAGRVNRGGSFGSAPDRERCANRAQNPQAEASAYRGFRLALSPVS